jgi:hypothetical protein
VDDVHPGQTGSRMIQGVDDMGGKPTGRAWAFVSSAWQKYSSWTKSSQELVDSLKERGYVTSVYYNGVKPSAYPSRKRILEARGLDPEEEITYSD